VRREQVARLIGSYEQKCPFWGEGWAQYWEFHLLERGLPRNNPDKIGMLFWRLHRANRIIFSLNYQLGNWTPEQAVDFLVEQGGFERAVMRGRIISSVWTGHGNWLRKGVARFRRLHWPGYFNSP